MATRPSRQSKTITTGDGSKGDGAGLGNDPLTVMRMLMNDPAASDAVRLRAAISLAQYTTVRLEHSGKKGLAKEKSKEVIAAGKFTPAQAPKLNGRQ